MEDVDVEVAGMALEKGYIGELYHLDCSVYPTQSADHLISTKTCLSALRSFFVLCIGVSFQPTFPGRLSVLTPSLLSLLAQ